MLSYPFSSHQTKFPDRNILAQSIPDQPITFFHYFVINRVACRRVAGNMWALAALAPDQGTMRRPVIWVAPGPTRFLDANPRALYGL